MLNLLLVLSSQIIGGNYDPYLSINGSADYVKLGYGDIAGVGDINGDGLGDFLVGNPFEANQGAKLYSGADLTVLRDYNNGGLGYYGRRLGNAGDTDGDGVSDYLLAAPDLMVNGMQWAGEVYLYSGASGALITTISGTAVGDHIGYVKGAGDINNDSYADFFVGAYMEDANGLADSGALYIYSGLDYSLLYKTTGSSEYSYWGFGSFDGGYDINLDGYDDYIVGNSNQKVANVYSGIDGSILFSYSSNQDDSLGNSVCMVPDVNGDGTPDFCIAASSADIAGQARAGKVIVHSGADGSVLLTLFGDHYFNRLGSEINYVGDVNGDGNPDLGVGNPGANDFGNAQVYDLASGALLQNTIGTYGSSQMGEHIAWVGDTTGDGKDNIITSDPLSSSNGFYLNGAVHVVDFNPIMTSDTVSVSAAAGGSVQFDINFSEHYRYHFYKVLASARGIGPAPLLGIQIPLTDGGAVWDTMLSQPPPAFFPDAFGVLDADGNTTATMNIAPGLASALSGSTLHFAVVSAASPAVLKQSSVAVSLLILP